LLNDLQLRPEPGDSFDKDGGGCGGGDRSHDDEEMGVGARRSASAAKVIRLQSSYPRLKYEQKILGTDSTSVLWELNDTHRRLAEITEKLIIKEVELMEELKRSDKRRVWRVVTGTQHAKTRPRHRCKFRAWAAWLLYLDQSRFARRLMEQEEQATAREEQQKAELVKQERMNDVLIKRIAEAKAAYARLEKSKHDLMENLRDLRQQLVDGEEGVNTAFHAIRDEKDRELLKLRNLQVEANIQQSDLEEVRRALKHRESKIATLNARLQSLEQQSKDADAELLERMLTRAQQSGDELMLALFKTYNMQNEPGFELVDKANMEYYAAHKRLGIFATKEAFLTAGLEAYNGRYVMSSEQDILSKMAREFCECKDPRIRCITTTNNGRVETDLEMEWEFAYCPMAGKTYPGQQGHPGTNDILVPRSPVPLDDLMNHPLVGSAHLIRAEVLALRLYTGPAHKVLNGALREDRFIKGKSTCPKYVYLDLPLLMNNVLQETDITRWRGAVGSSIALELKGVSKVLKWTDQQYVALLVAMRSVRLSPTTCVFINTTQKLLVIVDVVLEGEDWREWKETGVGFYVQRSEKDKRSNAIMRFDLTIYFAVFCCLEAVISPLFTH